MNEKLNDFLHQLQGSGGGGGVVERLYRVFLFFSAGVSAPFLNGERTHMWSGCAADPSRKWTPQPSIGSAEKKRKRKERNEIGHESNEGEGRANGVRQKKTRKKQNKSEHFVIGVRTEWAQLVIVFNL